MACSVPLISVNKVRRLLSSPATSLLILSRKNNNTRQKDSDNFNLALVDRRSNENQNLKTHEHGFYDLQSYLKWLRWATQGRNNFLRSHTHTSRIEVVKKTETLLSDLFSAENEDSVLYNVEQINAHLLSCPSSRTVASQNHLVKFLLKHLNSTKKPKLRDTIRICLNLCGHVEPPKGHGIRILAIDGGGTRGVIGLECLEALEREAGCKKLSDMFDLIVGVSTGAIIGTLIGAKEMPIAELKKAYHEVSVKLFGASWYRKATGLVGQMVYGSRKNSEIWAKILKETLGSDYTMVNSAGKGSIPKVAIVSCIVNTDVLMPYLFRNYEHPPQSSSHYRCSTKYAFWQALLASTAAPTYFEEVKLDDFVHQDGGILTNNPTAIAVNEARQLWPNENFQCIVSIGNGKTQCEIEPKTVKQPSTYRMFVGNMIEAATETETIHHCLSDIMPPNVGTYILRRLYRELSYQKG